MGRNLRIAFLALCAGCLVGCAVSAQTDLARLAPVERNETMEVFFFDCGKADSILLRQGEHTMLIDAATNEEGRGVVARLQEEGVYKLDALLITHEDKDHVGGAHRVLRALEVERAYVGKAVEGGKHMERFYEALEEKDMRAVTLVAGDHFMLGSALVTVIGPVGDGPREANDASLVLRVDFGQTAFLFAADAEDLSLSEMLYTPDARQQIRAQVLKAPHHGRAAALSTAFLNAVGPEIAVITCERGTEDDLPDPIVVAALERAGTRIYLTGDGEVKVTSDGFRLTVDTRPPAER